MPAQALVSIYQQCIDILRLHKNPQDLIVSRDSFLKILLVYSLVSYASAWVFLSLDVALIFAVLDIVLLNSFVYLCLFICGFVNRFRQTVTALAGISSIIGIVTIPVSLLADAFKDIPILMSLSTSMLILILIWNIVINAHIFRHAFSILFFGGIAIAVLYYLLINALVIVFIPEYFTS